MISHLRARSSVGERSLHTREVAGSSPAVPITKITCKWRVLLVRSASLIGRIGAGSEVVPASSASLVTAGAPEISERWSRVIQSQDRTGTNGHGSDRCVLGCTKVVDEALTGRVGLMGAPADGASTLSAQRRALSANAVNDLARVDGLPARPPVRPSLSRRSATFRIRAEH
jgi:hypothetical protein